jgi:glycosyltransferase involved in cell wall biosynthesis
MTKVCDQLKNYRCEIVYINDGSTDDTLSIIKKLVDQDGRVSMIGLSRNFGKEIAMTAGLDFARGDAVVIFDADLQDPPTLLLSFVEQWEAGYDVVYAKRVKRNGESWVKKVTATAFYKIMAKLSRVDIPKNTGDCRLMSRRVVEALNQLREQHRFMKGLFSWVGFPSTAVEYVRDPRIAGATKFNYWKLWNFALEGITSFTIGPLKMATYLGFIISALAIVFGMVIIVKTMVFGDAVRGFPTLIVTVLFLGGLQLFFIGVIGEYLGRVFGETKNRPLYIVADQHMSEINQNEKTNT